MSPSIFTKVPDESPKGAEIEKARRAAAEFGVKPQPTEFKVKEANGELLPEPLLTENPNRFVVFPIQHHDVWAMYVGWCWWWWVLGGSWPPPTTINGSHGP